MGCRGRIASSGPAVAPLLMAAWRTGAGPRPRERLPSSRAGRARGEDELFGEGCDVVGTRARSHRRPAPSSWWVDGRVPSSWQPPSRARRCACHPCRRCRRCRLRRRGRRRPPVPPLPVRRHRGPVASDGHWGADWAGGVAATRRRSRRCRRRRRLRRRRCRRDGPHLLHPRPRCRVVTAAHSVAPSVLAEVAACSVGSARVCTSHRCRRSKMGRHPAPVAVGGGPLA